MPAQPLDPLPRRFGRYVLFDRIGEGGMARIYLGRTKTGLGGARLVVVKQMLPMLSSSRAFSQLLIEEAKLASKLSHGNIVQVFDLGREESILYIAMEYVEGFDFRQVLQQCSREKVPLPVEFSLYVVAQVLRALDYAHRKNDEEGDPLGIVHRDVSPSNILLSFEGEVKLCDFGIARAIGINEQLFEETIQGKAGYMSPEAASAQAVDARSDVFSAGIVLWELLAGTRLYRVGPGRRPSLDQARAAEIPEIPARDFRDEARLYGIAMRALSKRPEDRYASARDMLADLEGYIADAGMFASPLRLGQWLMGRFGGEIIEARRARERAAKAIEAGPLVEISVRRDSQHPLEDEAATEADAPRSSRRGPRSERPPKPKRAPKSERPPKSEREPKSRPSSPSLPPLESMPAPVRESSAMFRSGSAFLGVIVLVLLWAWLFK